MRTSPERGCPFTLHSFLRKCCPRRGLGGGGVQGWWYLPHEQKGFKVLSPSILILFAAIVPYLNDFVSFSLFSL